jgi:hypothetical protein
MSSRHVLTPLSYPAATPEATAALKTEGTSLMTRSEIEKSRPDSPSLRTEPKEAITPGVGRGSEALGSSHDVVQSCDTSYGHRLWLVKYSNARVAGAVTLAGAGFVMVSPAGLVIGPVFYIGRTLGKAYYMRERMEEKINLQEALQGFINTIATSDDHYQLYKTAEHMSKRKQKFVEHDMTGDYLKWATAANYRGLAIEYSKTRTVVINDTEGDKIANMIAGDCKTVAKRTYRYWPDCMNLLVIRAKKKLQTDIQATRDEMAKGLPQESICTIRHQLGRFFQQNFPVEDRDFFEPDYLTQGPNRLQPSCTVKDGSILAEVFDIMLLCFAKERDLSVPGLIDGREVQE